MKRIGIDPGTKTGVACWDSQSREFDYIRTMTIVTAMRLVESEVSQGQEVEVFYEDARLRRWFGNKGTEALQGAGAIKRESGIWEEFLLELGVEFHKIPPAANATKLDAATFKQTTKYQGRTSEHGRDAAMLVYER